MKLRKITLLGIGLLMALWTTIIRSRILSGDTPPACSLSKLSHDFQGSVRCGPHFFIIGVFNPERHPCIIIWVCTRMFN